MPNARINPPEDNCGTDKFTMKDMLIPVGLNELFGAAWIEPRKLRITIQDVYDNLSNLCHPCPVRKFPESINAPIYGYRQRVFVILQSHFQ
jgi:hypothetical protein